MDMAIYWTEYVIRHKGALHLQTAAVHMPWYQYLLLDVIAFILVFIFLLLWLLKKLLEVFVMMLKKLAKEIMVLATKPKQK